MSVTPGAPPDSTSGTSSGAMSDPANGQQMLERIAALHDVAEYRDLNWTGDFADYLALVRKNPKISRTAYQRCYDMILSYGQEEYIDNKKKIVRFNFFKDEQHGGRDAVYGLDIPLMRLVNVFKSAAQRYGTERRVILLHGPVGSSKSTIARLLKRGLEEYSRSPDGMLFSFAWKNADGTWAKDPMHGEPLQLIPEEHRTAMLVALNEGAVYTYSWIPDLAKPQEILNCPMH